MSALPPTVKLIKHTTFHFLKTKKDIGSITSSSTSIEHYLLFSLSHIFNLTERASSKLWKQHKSLTQKRNFKTI